MMLAKAVVRVKGFAGCTVLLYNVTFVRDILAGYATHMLAICR